MLFTPFRLPSRINRALYTRRCCSRILPAFLVVCLLPPSGVFAWPLSPAFCACRLSPLADAKPHHKPRKAVENNSRAQVASSLTGPQSPLVRVCLLRYAGASQITVSVVPGAHLLDAQGRELAAGTGPWTFHAGAGNVQVSGQTGKHSSAISSAALWRVQTEDSAAFVGIKGSGSSARHYRGSLEVHASGGELRVINEVGMEPYLQGVVISEIGDGPLEALKAQAVAARTYAISSRGRWKSDGYDLRDSVDSQAYGGVEAESADGNRAVQDTAGQILTVRGQAIDADFCDDCGGTTAPGDDPDVLPRSVSDELAHRYAPHGVWTLALSPARLKTMLGKSGKGRGQGDLQNVEITQRDVSGRAARVRFTWGVGSPAAMPASPSAPAPSSVPSSVPSSSGDTTDARAAFPSRHAPLKRAPHGQSASVTSASVTSASVPSRSAASSKTFVSGQSAPGSVSAPAAGTVTTTEISGDSLRGLIGYNVLRSTLITMRRAPNGDFVFEGRGWGHGHGLCQQGALALAAPPLRQDCKTILAHYYPGARLGLWPLYDEEGAQR